MNSEKVHQGHNVRRFREMMGWKQEALASELGGDWTQRRISLLEQRDTIDTDILKEVSAALKIPVEAIKNFDEEKAIVNIQNNYEGANNGNGTLGNHISYEGCTINPIDKWMEALEENKKLYERMLSEKDEMIARLEKLIDKIK